MQTLSLFQELADPKTALKAVIKQDVEAAGGFKDVAPLVFPNALATAQQKLSNACNPKQKQELSHDEIILVAQLARQKSGRSHIFAYYAKSLDCELHWVTPAEKAERASVKLQDAAKSLIHAMNEAQELLRGIQ